MISNIVRRFLRFIYKEKEFIQVIVNVRSHFTYSHGRNSYNGEIIKVFNIKTKIIEQTETTNIPQNASLIQVGYYLYSFGGNSTFGISREALVIPLKQLGQFIHLPDLLVAKVSHSLCYYNANIFLLCGTINCAESNRCEMYSILYKRWKNIPKAIMPRERSCSCVINGIAYLIGGRNKTAALFTIEKLRIHKINSGWSTLAIRMNSIMWPSIDSKAIVISNDFILVGNKGQCYGISISRAETMNAKALYWNGKNTICYEFIGFVNNSYRIIHSSKYKAAVNLGINVEVRIN